jgi:hypothetical protein
MYKNNLAVSIKVNGKFVKETENEEGSFRIPFNSEYSIYIKNLDSRDVSVKISIDGNDVLDNSNLIIRGNSFGEVNGFLKGGVFKNKFKFIEKTKETLFENNREDVIDDGIIRIEYQFTKVKKEKNISITSTTWPGILPNITWFNYNPYKFNNDYNTDNAKFTSSSYFYENINGEKSYSSSYQDSSGRNFTYKSENPPNSYKLLDESKSDEGITVKGSRINEKVDYAWIDELEENKNVIIIKLRPLTKDESVKVKLFCTICGTELKYNYKYCPRCGNKI